MDYAKLFSQSRLHHGRGIDGLKDEVFPAMQGGIELVYWSSHRVGQRLCTAFRWLLGAMLALMPEYLGLWRKRSSPTSLDMWIEIPKIARAASL